MFTKILFPTDFSKSSEKVKEELKKMKGCGIGKVVLLNVLDIRIFSYSTMLEVIEIENFNKEGDIVKGIQKKLDEWANELISVGIKAEGLVKEGIPFNEILNFAENEEVTSIILGHQGTDAVERMLLGSTAEKVARKSHVPTILVK